MFIVRLKFMSISRKLFVTPLIYALVVLESTVLALLNISRFCFVALLSLNNINGISKGGVQVV